MQWHVPTLADVLEARLRISPHLRPTPLYSYSTLNDLLGAEVFVKQKHRCRARARSIRATSSRARTAFARNTLAGRPRFFRRRPGSLLPLLRERDPGPGFDAGPGYTEPAPP